MSQDKPVTIGSLVAEFQSIYGLSDFDYAMRHDATHGMTGYNISIADEIRLFAVQEGLHGGTLAEAFDIAERAHHSLAKEKQTPTNVSDPLLESPFLAKTRPLTNRLNPLEVEAQYTLGKKIKETVLRLTGKDYIKLTPREIAALKFKDLNFVAEAHEIKAKYESPENKTVEEMMIVAFRAAARHHKMNPDAIPAAGYPWHGPDKKVCTVRAAPA